MTTKIVVFSLGNVNTVGKWKWQLELVQLRRGWFRAKTKCYSYDPPGTPGGSFKFRRGSELWEWLKSTWSETTLEILYPEHGIMIADNTSEIEPALGIDFREASMRSWVARALADYEFAPTRPSRVDSIMKCTKWLEPWPSGSGGAMQMGLNMASARRAIKCFVARGEPFPRGTKTPARRDVFASGMMQTREQTRRFGIHAVARPPYWSRLRIQTGARFPDTRGRKGSRLFGEPFGITDLGGRKPWRNSLSASLPAPVGQSETLSRSPPAFWRFGCTKAMGSAAPKIQLVEQNSSG